VGTIRIGVRRAKRGTVTLFAAALVVVGLTTAGSSNGAAGTRNAAKRGTLRAFAAKLAVPSAGDVSYGVARVRIAPGSRAPALPLRVGGPKVFGGRVGGLAIVARAQRLRALRGVTKVYVVVWRVAGANAAVRDVAFFILRRRTGARPDRSAAGDVVFSIANATPARGSFWIRRVDRGGYADVFHVRDALTTALGNWGRYLRVLAAAHALAAALHPLDLTRTLSTRPRAARGRGRSVWTAGQRPSARLRAIFDLIDRTVVNPNAYAAAKSSPLIPQFIAHDLGNPRLARRWSQVTAKLPLRIPDRYAAAAQEEARFTKVTPPRISAASVSIADFRNSSSQLASDQEASSVGLGKLSVIIVGGPRARGEGTVLDNPLSGFSCNGGYAVTMICSGSFAGWVTLVAYTGPNSSLARWTGCDQVFAGGYQTPINPTPVCTVDVTPSGRAVYVTFDLDPGYYGLSVTTDGSGYGIVSGTGFDPTVHYGAGNCGVICYAFPAGQAVTLTATPDSGSRFAGWSGCDASSGETCSFTMNSNRDVTAHFEAATPYVITPFAGDGRRCAMPSSCGDNGLATSAQLAHPDGVAFDPATGNVYIADTQDNEVRRVAPDGTITTIAGNGNPCSGSGSCGDNGPATAAKLDGPSGVTVDSSGNVYIADTFDNKVREVAANGGIISTIAGNGTFCQGAGSCGDNGPATDANLNGPGGVAVDSSGNVYIADTFDNKVREVAAGSGTIATIAGTGGPCQGAGSCGDTGPATAAELQAPGGVALDSGGNVYIADTFDNKVRKVAAHGGTITTLAGTGAPCGAPSRCGDNGSPTNAELNGPNSVAVDGGGNVYIADTRDNEVRMVAAGGSKITTIAGTGAACTATPCDDGNPATQAQLAQPYGVAVDPSSGNIYIADTYDNEVRKLS
jgi:sugar lactone lactonase YvrE